VAAQCVNYFTLHSAIGWRISLGLAGAPALLLVLGCIVGPETPNSLVRGVAGGRVAAAARGRASHLRCGAGRRCGWPCPTAPRLHRPSQVERGRIEEARETLVKIRGTEGEAGGA
jgi:hypothetical protein